MMLAAWRIVSRKSERLLGPGPGLRIGFFLCSRRSRADIHEAAAIARSWRLACAHGCVRTGGCQAFADGPAIGI